MCTSREDPCPIILLEALYMKIPCIVLGDNITYKHNLSSNYYIVPNHDNNYLKISDYIKQKINLQKRKNCNLDELREYIEFNFSQPKFLKDEK